MSEQLVFDLPHRAALGADDFLVSASNEAAVRLVDAWPDWPHRLHLIEGPKGCGKSHLANVWRLRTGARPLDVSALRGPDVSLAGYGSGLILEDLDRADFDEKALFHLLNRAGESGLYALLTARAPAARWAVKLPDLASRLRSVPSVTIGPPDDVLLGAVLVKHFTDRQLNVEPRVLTYLARRMERSMADAARVAEAIDRAALKERRRITRQFAGKVLDRLGTPPDSAG